MEATVPAARWSRGYQAAAESNSGNPKQRQERQGVRHSDEAIYAVLQLLARAARHAGHIRLAFTSTLRTRWSSLGHRCDGSGAMATASSRFQPLPTEEGTQKEGDSFVLPSRGRILAAGDVQTVKKTKANSDGLMRSDLGSMIGHKLLAVLARVIELFDRIFFAGSSKLFCALLGFITAVPTLPFECAGTPMNMEMNVWWRLHREPRIHARLFWV